MIVGYLLGGTYERVLVGGAASGTTLELELGAPGRRARRDDCRDARQRACVASGDIASPAVSSSRAPTASCESSSSRRPARRLAPEPQGVRRIAVVLDAENAFVAGGFVGLEDCSFWACDSELTSFTRGDTITAGLETDGECSRLAVLRRLDRRRDLERLLRLHRLLLGRSPLDDRGYRHGHYERQARAVLAARLEIAAALEGGAPLPAPLPGSDSYLTSARTSPACAPSSTSSSRPTRGSRSRSRGRATSPAPHPRALSDLVDSG